MKILLVHPEDDPEKGPWANQHWDRVIDLGLGGEDSYARWSRRFHCPVTTLSSLRHGFADLRRVRDLLGLGRGRLIDAHGLDWWEIISLLLHAELEELVLLHRLVETLGPDDEVHVSRAGLHASLLQSLRAKSVSVFPLRRDARKSGIGHYIRVSRKLSASQMIDVLCDKYDAGYQFRGRLRRKRWPSQRPMVLLPTAYINVSRTGIAYANTFPEENFLLVSTRRSGWVKNLPKNVTAAWLSSYASVRDRTLENEEIENRWQSLLQEFSKVTELGILKRLGSLDNFPQHFRHGFEVRDAWRNVLDTEPVQAVLCADDSNPYTRIPLLLAQARGLPNIACHHGALDGRYVFKRSLGDVIWVKGKMEEDYLLRKCEVRRERIEIAAPALPAQWNELEPLNRATFRPYLLFISEASDVSGGRPEEFYRDLLPPLADLAQSTGRTLIVKLHPAESQSERAAIVARILNAEQQGITRVVSGPLTDELLSKAWFGITILSTVAMECAIRGIPCFLCKWLDFSPYGYVDQFVRFGVGICLHDSGQIKNIPDYLRQQSGSADLRENYWRPAAPGRLRELLASSPKACTAAVQK